MKTIKTSALFCLLAILLSCCSNQVEKSIQDNNYIHGSIKITPLDTKQLPSHINIDTVHSPIMSGGNPFQGSPMDTWTIYLPFSDSLKLYVSDIKGNLIHESPVKLMKQGFYRLSIHPDLRIDKDGVYILKAAFCGSSFAKRFLILR